MAIAASSPDTVPSEEMVTLLLLLSMPIPMPLTPLTVPLETIIGADTDDSR